MQIVSFIVLILITCTANMYLYSPVGRMALENKKTELKSRNVLAELLKLIKKYT